MYMILRGIDFCLFLNFGTVPAELYFSFFHFIVQMIDRFVQSSIYLSPINEGVVVAVFVW